MPDFVVNSLPAAVIALIGLLLGVVAYRRFNTKQLGEIQEKVIETYQSESKVLTDKVNRLEGEARLMRAAFKRLGMDIEINGNVITLIDSQQPKRVRIMEVEIENEKNKDKKEV